MIISKEHQKIISEIVQHEKDIKWLSKFDYAKSFISGLVNIIESKKDELKKGGVDLE